MGGSLQGEESRVGSQGAGEVPPLLVGPIFRLELYSPAQPFQAFLASWRRWLTYFLRLVTHPSQFAGSSAPELFHLGAKLDPW